MNRSRPLIRPGLPLVATYSIIGHDPRNGDLGVAVQSKFLAVGAVVPWAKAGVGAIATQSFANTTYGPLGLELLEGGCDPQEVIDRLVGADDHPGLRQIGIVDKEGRAATYSGDECYVWAGGQAGPHFAAQGNILVSGATIDAMAQTFVEQQVSGEGELADHLIAALAAGQAAGGDSRGMQAAALLVVRAHGGYGAFNDRYVDIRVDDHPSPINELRRILDLHHLYFQDPDPAALLPIEGPVLGELRELLCAAGYLITIPTDESYDEVTVAAFTKFTGRENLEDRVQPGALLDPVVLKYLRGLVEDAPLADYEPAVHITRSGESSDAHADHAHLHLVRRSDSER